MSMKEPFIIHLRLARARHLKWLNNVKLLVSGLSVDGAQLPPNQSESEFGIWFYEEAMAFSISGSRGVLAELDELHTRCYHHFLQIHHLFAGTRRGGLLQTLFGTKRAGESELILAQKYYEELVEVSDALLGRLRVFESQMMATPESKFDELMLNAEAPAEHLDIATSAPKVQRMYRGQPVD